MARMNAALLARQILSLTADADPLCTAEASFRRAARDGDGWIMGGGRYRRHAEWDRRPLID